MISTIDTNLINNIINQQYELITLSAWMHVEGIDNDTNINGEAIVVLTNVYIYVLQYNSASKLVQKLKKPIITTGSIFFDGGSTITLKFSENCIISIVSTAIEIASIYQMQLSEILVSDEFPKVSDNIKIKHPGRPYFMKRFKASCAINNTFPDSKLLDELDALMKTCPTELSLTDIQDLDNYFDPLTFALLAENRVAHLTVNGHPSFPFSTIAKNIKYLPRIKWLTLCQTPDEYFPKFIEKLMKSSVDRIDFEDIAITAPALDKIYELILKKSLTRLSFNHVSFNMKESSVNELFTNIKETNQVGMIGFTTMHFEKRRELQDIIFSLNVVILQGTDLELSDLLRSLSHTRVQSADFSGTRCRELIDPKMKLNSSLLRLVLNHISCTAESLASIVRIANNHAQPLALAFAFAKLTEQQWKEFFNIEITLKNISVLIWTNNPTTPAFVKAISKSQIKYLGIAGRKSAQDAVDIIDKTSSVEYIDVSGTNNKLGGDAIRVLQSIKKARNIKNADISMHNIGNAHMQKFYDLAENLDGFICDKNDFTDYAIYEKLIDECRKKRKKITAACPYIDYSKTSSGKKRKIPIDEFESCWSLRTSTQTPQANEWKSRVIGHYVSPIPPEHASSIQMIPAPLSDYELLLEEKEEEKPNQESINQWALEVLEVPTVLTDNILTELSECYTMEKVAQSLLKMRKQKPSK